MSARSLRNGILVVVFSMGVDVDTLERMPKYIQALLLIAVLVGLAGCGGGGGGGGGASKPSGSSTNATVRASGKIVDTESNPVAGADVIMPYGDNKVWGGTSDANGNVNFQVRVSDFKGVNPVVMIIAKDGYRPKTLFFPPVKAGVNIDMSTVVLERLAPNEFVPKQSIGLWHLGDGRHTGSANSGLQASLFGASITFEVTDWDQAKWENYKAVTVQFVGRGLQGTGGGESINCTAGYDNRVRIFSVQNDVTHGENHKNPGNSDPSGQFSEFQIDLNVEQFPVGSKVFVGFTSGACLNPSISDLDDFEVTEILVSFTP